MDLLKPLIALLAIVNPVGVVPFFIHFTQNLDPAAAAAAHHPHQLVRRLLRDRDQCAGGAAHHRVLRHLDRLVPGRRRHAAADQRAGHAQRAPAESKPDDMSDGERKRDAGDSIAVVPLTIPCSPARRPSRRW
jgi:multiple antibiotic resistance protein